MKNNSMDESGNSNGTTPEISEAPKDSASIKKALDDYARVGETQQMMAKLVGVWNEDITAWDTPDGKPYKLAMTATSEMILGGRYQQIAHKAIAMGAPYEASETLGYDNAAQKWNSIWIDSMSTGIINMAGDYDIATKTVSLKGEMVSPVSKKAEPVRVTITFIDDNTRKVERFNTAHDGKEYKSREFVVTRQK